MFAQRFGLDLSSPFTQNIKDLKQLLHDPCPHQFPGCKCCLQQKSRFAITFVRLVPDSSSFDKVGIRSGPLNRDRRGVMLRETHVSVRKIDRSVLAINVDAELILKHFVLMACVRRGVGQMAREFPLQAK